MPTNVQHHSTCTFSTLLQLKGDHAAAFEAVKHAVTLRCVCASVCAQVCVRARVRSYVRACVCGQSRHHAHAAALRTSRAQCKHLTSPHASASHPRCSPSVPQLYNNLCVLFRNMKKFDDARKAASQCLAALPHYAPALNNIALLQITVGQLMDADGNLRAAAEADPGLVCAQSNAGNLQVRCMYRPFHLLPPHCEPPPSSLPLQKLRQRELQRIHNLGGVNFG